MHVHVKAREHVRARKDIVFMLCLRVVCRHGCHVYLRCRSKPSRMCLESNIVFDKQLLEFLFRRQSVKQLVLGGGLLRNLADHHKANLTSYWPNVFVKLASIPVAVTLILAFSALMPRSDSVIQRAGMRALCPYIFHYHFLLGIWKYTKWLDDWELKHSIPLYLCLAIYVWVLYLPIVYRVVSQIIFMPLDKMGIFKED